MSDESNSVEAIKARLSHPYIRERQAALNQIEEWLANNQQVRACIEMLQEVVRTSEYLIVADQARDILDGWQRKNEVMQTHDDRQHIFGVVCRSCGHQNYYDKREVCGSHGSLYLGKAEGGDTDELLLECQKCHESFVVHVNCERYK